MILTLALALTALGIAGIAVGYVTDMTGVAVIGAVIIVGVGATVTVTGLQYRDGQTKTHYNNSTGPDTTEVEPTYAELDTADKLPLGFLWMLFGAVPTLQFIQRAGGT